MEEKRPINVGIVVIPMRKNKTTSRTDLILHMRVHIFMILIIALLCTLILSLTLKRGTTYLLIFLDPKCRTRNSTSIVAIETRHIAHRVNVIA